MRFEKGDEVEVTNSGETYTYTHNGSRGIIEAIDMDQKCYLVKFYYLTGESVAKSHTAYPIPDIHLKYAGPVTLDSVITREVRRLESKT